MICGDSSKIFGRSASSGTAPGEYSTASGSFSAL